MRFQRILLCVIVAIVASAGAWSVASTPIDGGFESYAVTTGGFILPTSGPWLFNNNAGVVEPFAPHSSTSPSETWSATLPAWEGSQYASAYAGSDWFDQSVFFPAAGNYALSVYAASPSGSVTISSATLALTTGEFRFALRGVVTGPAFSPPLDGGWAQYTTVVGVPSAGNRLVGFHTTKSAPFFINFDAISVTAVPEPTGVSLGIVGAGAWAVRRRARRRRLSAW